MADASLPAGYVLEDDSNSAAPPDGYVIEPDYGKVDISRGVASPPPTQALKGRGVGSYAAALSDPISNAIVNGRPISDTLRDYGAGTLSGLASIPETLLTAAGGAIRATGYGTKSADTLDRWAGNIRGGIDALASDPNSPEYRSRELGGMVLGSEPLTALDVLPGTAALSRYGNLAIQGGAGGALTSRGENVGANVIGGAVLAPALGAVVEHGLPLLGKVARGVVGGGDAPAVDAGPPGAAIDPETLAAMRKAHPELKGLTDQQFTDALNASREAGAPARPAIDMGFAAEAVTHDPTAVGTTEDQQKLWDSLSPAEQADVLAKFNASGDTADVQVSTTPAETGKAASAASGSDLPAGPQANKPGVVGDLPRAGVAPGNVGQDGKDYVADPGQSHFDVMEKYPDVQWNGGTGFVDPNGNFLNREDALAFVNSNGERIRPPGSAPSELDALDYREQSQNIPPPSWSPERASWDAAHPQTVAMDHEPPSGYSLEGPAVPDEAASNDVGPPRGASQGVNRPPPGYVLDEPDLTPRQQPRPLSQSLTPEQIADIARGISPDDVKALPASEIENVDEAVRANPGTTRDVVAPDERDALPPYQINGRTRRNPIDLLGWLRTQGGIRESGGELAHMGITNKARNIDFAKDEGFLGKLIDNKNGMSFDDAAHAAWEAGFFPDHDQRPTIDEFLDALRATHEGGPARVFHPEDYDTIDAYHNALRQRGAIETAQQNGAPLAEQIGEPATMSDLEANSAPVTAYEDLPKLGGKVGNISIDRLETTADIRRALRTTDQRFGGFDAARRGRITQAETEALALELNMTADDLLKRQPGRALNAEQALAARQILAKSADRLMTLARKAQGGSDEDLTAFRQAMVQHAAIQEQVAGMTAEAGRTLAQFRIMADAKAASPKAFEALNRSIIDAGGGRGAIETAAKHLLDLDSIPKRNSFVRKAAKPDIGDKLTELYINSMLSGPQTHAANFLSNSLTAVLQIPEHATASALGMLRFKSGDRVLPGEVPTRAFGMLQGAREGMAMFAQTMRTGHVADHVSKVEAAEQEAISGLKGKIIRTPTKALSAADELFKGIARRMELNGLALRQARAEGKTGQALAARVAELSANPTDEMTDKAADYARYLTFQRPLGEIGQAVSRASGAKIGPLPIGKLIVPFVRTPANLLKFAAERSPMAPLLKVWRDDMIAGGARRDLAASKALLGSGMGLMFAQWAKQGIITGSGPADPAQVDALRATGWQPYSVKIGGRYYSYARLDPLSTTLGTAADLATKGDVMTEGQKQEAAGVIAAAVINNLASKTWLSGVSDLSNMVQDPLRYGGSYVRNEVSGIAVPTLLAQIAKVHDPVVRQSNTIMDAVRSRIPVLSEGVLPRQTVWGDNVKRDQVGYGVDLASPIAVSDVKNDRTLSEVARLVAQPSTASKKIGDVPLSPQQYSELVTQAGQPAKQALDRITSTPQWDRLPDTGKRLVISKVVHAYRGLARGEMLMGDPALMQAYAQGRVDNAMAGR